MTTVQASAWAANAAMKKNSARSMILLETDFMTYITLLLKI